MNCRFTICLLAVCALLAFVCPSKPASAAAVKESVLVVIGPGGYGFAKKVDPEFYDRMKDAGIALDQTLIANATVERMKQYNVVLFYGVPEEKDSAGLKDYEKFLPNVKEYVKAGGGFLYLDNSYGGHAQSGNMLMEEFGIHFTEQTVFDDTLAFTDPDTGNSQLLYTTNIETHPITRGVDKIIFPGFWHNVAGFVPDNNWTVVIKGEDTTKTRLNFEVWGKGEYTYESNPPIVAVRDYEKGRMVVFPINFVWTVQDGYGSTKGVVLEKGNVRQILLNMFDWLAAPSLKSGSIGGFDGSTFEEIPQTEWYKPVPLEAQRPKMNVYKGLIGARSTYSGCENSIKEMCDKAKELGLNYLVFTEDFAYARFDKSPAKWDEYTKEVAAQDTDTFIALAGYEYENTIGVRWIDFDRFQNLKRVQVTDDGKSKELNMWGFVSVTAPINTSNLPDTLQPMWRALKFYTSSATKVYDKGALIDDSFNKYITTISNKYWSRPITVHKCYSVDDLEQAAKSDDFKTYALSPDITTLAQAFHRKTSGYPLGNATYVSNGPIIHEFTLTGGRWTLDPFENYFLYRPGDVGKIYIDVSSDADLSEVLLMKSAKVERRFLTRGEIFKTEVDWVFADDGIPYLIVKDSAGREAVSYSFMIRHDTFWAAMCADLQNLLAGSVFGRVQKGGMLFRGEYRTSWGGSLWTGNGGSGAVIDPVVVPEEAPGLESESHSVFTKVRVGFGDSPTVRTQDGSISLGATANDFAFASAEIQKFSMKYGAEWEKGLNDTIETESVITAYPVEMNEYNYMTVEQKLRFKKDVKLTEDGTLQIKMLVWYPNSTNFPHFTVIDRNGNKTSQIRKDNPAFVGKLNRTGYVSFWPQVSGACGLFVLDDNIYDIDITDSGVSLGYNLPGKEVKKGTEFTTRFLLVRDNGTFDNDAGISSFGNAYGILGPVQYKLNVKQGSVSNTLFALDAEAADGVFEAKFTENNLPTQLITSVKGISSNIPCYYFNKTTGDKRLLGVDGDTAILTEKFGKSADIVIGNVLDCSDSDIMVDLLDYTDTSVTLNVHNPTDEDKTVTIATKDAFSFLPKAETTVVVKAGSSATLKLVSK